MKVRIGNDICLYVNLLGNKNLDAVNINSVEAYLINVSKWHDIMDESFRESALMQDEINCRKDKIKFVSRFPVEPHFPGFHPTPYDVCCTGHPCYHQHPIPYIPMYHGYGVHPHTFERGCFGPCAWHTNHPHHLHFPHGYHHHFDNCHCCEPHTWDCDDMCDVYERAGIKHLDMQRQLDRCRFLAPVESTASKNKIKVYFPANAQLYTGTYKLVIVAKIHEPGFCENNLRVVTIDYENVFTLVNHCEDGLDGDIIIRVGTNKFDPSDIKAVRPYAEGYTIYEGDQLALNDIDVNGKQYKLLIDLVDGRTIEYDPDEWEFGAINFDNDKKNVITVSENFGTIITMADSAGKDDVVLVYDNTHTQLTSYTVNVIEREPEPQPKLVEAISSINGPDRVKIGSSATYTVTFDPSDADTGTGITWEVVSGDATIDLNGRLTVGGEGTVVIRVTSENGKSKEKTITVYDDTPVTPTEIEPSSVSISGVSRMDERTATTFSAVVSPSNANTNTSVQWSVIGVGNINQNGVYTAPSVDSDTQVTIVAITGNGKRDEKIITVVDTDTPVVNPDYSFLITDYPQQVKVGANNMCRVTYNDPITDDYSGFVWTWTPSDAITTAGDATGRTFAFTAAKAYDDVTVTATLGSDSDSITFTTYTDEEPENPPVSENWELVILGEDRSIPVGGSIQLNAVIQDSVSGETKTETISWTTSNTNAIELTPNGASVTVTGKDISPETTATATITATSQSGLTGSVTVGVYQETQNPLEIRLEGVWYMNKDDEQTVTAIVLPLVADKRVTWSSSNDSIATVAAIDDSHAKVTAVNKGTVTITATSVVDNSVKGTMDIEITDPNDVRVTSITIDPITVEKGAYVDVRPYIHMTQANGEHNTEYVNCTYTPTDSSLISISREGDLVGLEVTDGTTFTVTYNDGVTTPISQIGTVVVTTDYVEPEPDPVGEFGEILTITPSSDSIHVGDTVTLTITSNPGIQNVYDSVYDKYVGSGKGTPWYSLYVNDSEAGAFDITRNYKNYEVTPYDVYTDDLDNYRGAGNMIAGFPASNADTDVPNSVTITVVAKKAGTFTVTANSRYTSSWFVGGTGSCTINVVESQAQPESISINIDGIRIPLYGGDTLYDGTISGESVNYEGGHSFDLHYPDGSINLSGNGFNGSGGIKLSASITPGNANQNVIWEYYENGENNSIGNYQYVSNDGYIYNGRNNATLTVVARSAENPSLSDSITLRYKNPDEIIWSDQYDNLNSSNYAIILKVNSSGVDPYVRETNEEERQYSDGDVIICSRDTAYNLYVKGAQNNGVTGIAISAKGGSKQFAEYGMLEDISIPGSAEYIENTFNDHLVSVGPISDNSEIIVVTITIDTVSTQTDGRLFVSYNDNSNVEYENEAGRWFALNQHEGVIPLERPEFDGSFTLRFRAVDGYRITGIDYNWNLNEHPGTDPVEETSTVDGHEVTTIRVNNVRTNGIITITTQSE